MHPTAGAPVDPTTAETFGMVLLLMLLPLVLLPIVGMSKLFCRGARGRADRSRFTVARAHGDGHNRCAAHAVEGNASA